MAGIPMPMPIPMPPPIPIPPIPPTIDPLTLPARLPPPPCWRICIWISSEDDEYVEPGLDCGPAAPVGLRNGTLGLCPPTLGARDESGLESDGKSCGGRDKDNANDADESRA